MRGARLLGLLLAVLVLSGCGGVSRVAASVPSQADDRVTLVIGGVPVDSSLAGVSLAGDIAASLRVDPVAEPRHARELALTLERPGGPVLDANVIVNGSMRFMDHGSFRAVAAPLGGGRYSALLPLAMPGEWQIEISVTSGRDVGRLSVDLDTFD